MTEDEGRRLAAIPKWGDPRTSWSQDRPNTFTNAFGVVDQEGKAIKGMQVDFEVFVSPRLGLAKYVFSLRHYDLGRPERAYQLHINCRPGLRTTDHGCSHEHYGEPRFNADASWSVLSFDEAVKRFCEKASLQLESPLPDYQEFSLK